MTEDKNDNPDVIDTARDEKVSELEIMHQSLQEKQKQSDDYLDRLQRLKAEFDNYRKRVEKEKVDRLLWGKEEILLKQVTLLDVLDQAVQSVTKTASIDSIRKGLELLRQEFVKMMASEGIAEIAGLGKIFDHNLHEAVEQQESEEPEGTIIGVVQKGYTLNGRVIRHEKVQVAKPKAEAAEKGPEKE